MLFRTWLAWRKSRPILLTPAGDPSAGVSCDCGGDFLLAESGDPISQETTEPLSPEP